MKALALLFFVVASASAMNTNIVGEYVGAYYPLTQASGASCDTGQIFCAVGTNKTAHVILAIQGNVIAEFDAAVNRYGVAKGIAPTGAEFRCRFRGRAGVFYGRWKIPGACKGRLLGEKRVWSY